ncbi:hypothetical protein PZA11_001215 [Diplocarpon coronariae]
MDSAQVVTHGEAAQLVIRATPPATISPQQSIYRLSAIFYSPDRTFIVPVVFTVINISTTLKSLIIRLQELLDQNMNLTHSSSKLLVQSLQMRFYHEGSLVNLPKIEGRVERSDPGSSFVVWNVCEGHGHDTNLLWSMLIRKLLVDQILRPKMTGKETVLKVGTVAKVTGSNERHDVVRYRHVFETLKGSWKMQSLMSIEMGMAARLSVTGIHVSTGPAMYQDTGYIFPHNQLRSAQTYQVTASAQAGHQFQYGNGPTGLSSQSALVQQAEESRRAVATKAKIEFQKVAEQCEIKQQKVHQSQQTGTPSLQQMRRELNINKDDFQHLSEHEEQRRTSSLWNELNGSKAELKRLHEQAGARVQTSQRVEGPCQVEIQRAFEHQNRDLVARGLDLNTPRGPRPPRPAQPSENFLSGRRESDLKDIRPQIKQRKSCIDVDESATREVGFADPSHSNEEQDEITIAESAQEAPTAIPVISLSAEIPPLRAPVKRPLIAHLIHRLPLPAAAKVENSRAWDQRSSLDASLASFTPSHNPDLIATPDSRSNANAQDTVTKFATPWPQIQQTDIEQKMDDAQALLKSLGLADAATEIMASVHDEASKEKYKSKLGGKKPNEGSEWKQGGGYDKCRAMDPDANWSIYQRWGEEGKKDENRERVHQLLDLSHVPFHGPRVEVWREHEASGHDHDDGESLIEQTPVPSPVPHTEIDADELKDALDERCRNQPLPEHIQEYWAEQERVKGFEKLDDTQYFPRHQLAPEPRSPSPKLHTRKKGKMAGGDNVDVRSMFLKSVERRAQESAHPALSRPAGMFEGNSSGGTTFSREHAAADNMFTPTLITSFGQLAKSSVKSATPALGFYDLLDGIKNYKSGSSYDSYAMKHGSPGRTPETIAPQGDVGRGDEYAEYQQSQETGSSFPAHFNSGYQHEFASHEGFSNIGSSMMMGGGGGTYQNPSSSFGNFNTAHPQSHPGPSYSGNHDMQAQASYHSTEQYGDSQWTSMSTGAGPPQAQGAAYDSFGSQASYPSRNVPGTPVSHPDSRYSLPQQYLPTPTPASRHQPDARERHSEAQTQGYGQMQEQMQAPSSTYDATTFPPAANLANRRGAPINPRPRRPIPITAPPETLSANPPAFTLPSPSR